MFRHIIPSKYSRTQPSLKVSIGGYEKGHVRGLKISNQA